MALLKERDIATICGFCHANCGLIAHVSDGILRRIKADPSHPANRGYICPKGLAAKQVIYSPDRLKYPLRRTKNGFRRISWDEALDIVATHLLEIRSKYGAQTVVRCSGAPVTEAAKDGFIQLFAAYGSPNLVGSAHLCHTPRQIIFDTVYGSMSQPDYKNTKCMVVWGSNPADSRRLGEDAAYGRFTKLIPEAKQ